MPILGGANLKTIELPSSTPEDRAEVTINMNITAEVALLMDGMQTKENKEQVAMMMEALSKIIVNWNFTLADKVTIAPITPQNVGMMGITDLIAIQKEIAVKTEKLDDDKKKALSSSLPPINQTSST